MLFVFVRVYWYPTGFPCQMMFASFASVVVGVTCGTETVYPYVRSNGVHS